MIDPMAGVDAQDINQSGLRTARGQGFMRRALLRIHRIIGLIVGAVFVLIGLSGAILAFRDDIDEALNASLMRVEIPAQEARNRPFDEILAAATAAMPKGARPERLVMPRHSGAAAAVIYMVETDDLDTFSYELFVDPYRAKVTGQRLYQHGDDLFSQPPLAIVLAFHWTLLMGPNNAYIVGGLGLVLCFSILIGFYLWSSFGGDWRLGLKVKWGASPERTTFDIHRSVGAYFLVILLVMLITGVAMIFKPVTRAALSKISHLQAEPDFGRSKLVGGQAPIGLDAAVAAADRVFPDGRLHWILLPSAADGVYVIGKQAAHEPNRTKTYRNVGVDQYSGKVLGVQDRETFSAGDRIWEWLFPLHSGEAFGEIGKPLTLLIGLAPLVLYVSGVLRWRQRRRVRTRGL